MGQYQDPDYAFLAKVGFLLGLGLLVLGAGGEIIGHVLYDTLPEWENTLFVYSEALGLVVGFFSVWIFGVFMPLVK